MRPGTDVAGETVRDRWKPCGAGQGRPSAAYGMVDFSEWSVGIANLRHLLNPDPTRSQQLRIPSTGSPIQHSGPRRCRRSRRSDAEDLEVDVLTERHPVVDAAEGLRHRVAQPFQPRRQVARVQPASSALLNYPLVEFASQLGDLGRAARVGVGEARCASPPIGADAHQGGGERVQGHTTDPSSPPFCREGRDDLVHFRDNLVRVYLGRAVSIGGELVRNLVPTALDRAPCRVKDVSPARGGTDVDGQHERIECLTELDSAAGCRHGVHWLISGVRSGSWGPVFALAAVCSHEDSGHSCCRRAIGELS